MSQMTRVNFPIVGGFSKERNVILGAERTINMYVIKMDTPYWPSEKVFAGLKRFPGLGIKREFVGTTGGRAAWVDKQDPSIIYQVVGNTIWRGDTSLLFESIGTLNTSQGHVGIDQNQTQIMFVDGVEGWIWDKTDETFTQITDVNFPNRPIDVVMIDNYFVVPVGETNEWRISHIGNGFVWTNSNNVAMNDFLISRPDIIQGLGTLNRNLFIFGNEVIEVWYDSGSSPFPFTRYNSVLPSYGCAAIDSISEGFGYLVFLASDNNGSARVMATKGIEFSPISTDALEDTIENFSDISDANGNLIHVDGNTFYILNFTTANRTFYYHFETQLWGELQSEDGSRYIGQTHVYFNNHHYVTAYNDNYLYEMSSSHVAYGLKNMNCIRISRTIADESGNHITLGRIQVNGLKGSGTQIGPETYQNPAILLSISRDEGQTFGYDMPLYVGASGNTRFQNILDSTFDSSRSYIFKLQYYPETDYIVTDMVLDLRVEIN